MIQYRICIHLVNLFHKDQVKTKYLSFNGTFGLLIPLSWTGLTIALKTFCIFASKFFIS